MSNVQSIERAFKLLEVLSEFPDGIQITRLAEKVNLSKSTVHRLLATLIDLKYVSKDRETEKYRIGYRLIYLSRNLIDNIDIISIAKPFLEDLSAEVNETIHLCIEDCGEVLYVDKIESNQTIRMISKIGNRAPMYCTGVGKALLSGMNREQFDNVANKTNFIIHTPTTISTKEELWNEVQLIKQQGYALDNVEHEEGIRCIAAPIFNSEKKIIASFSIAGPSNRITMERIEFELIEKIRKTSLDISRMLDYKVGSSLNSIDM
ncbi:transcriptional regulator, IclR family [Planococcus sp. PAMC 21323]|uniref:IclR family transcriptional regulator n=1 Tax=Planococcus sp. PAMC 21323 TaxID=1526927 RepID=UPI00056E1F6F|nr:IclR family transcriptional regulator [Planococcus sp. PAMC 21323]AIY06667.1 transcriptional regulator, IclR family [Planococcus sp. PAMC 21323]